QPYSPKADSQLWLRSLFAYSLRVNSPQSGHISYVSVSRRRRGRFRRGFRRARARELLHHIEARRDDEDGDDCGGQHADDHDRAEDAPPRRARTRRDPQGYAAPNEREGGHQDWAQPHAGALKRRIYEAPSFLQLDLGELNDQDRVLRRQTDEHDQTDLGVHVQIVAPQYEAAEGAEDRHRYCQQHRERQRPTLVERRQDQEDEYQRQGKRRPRRPRSLPLLVREIAPVVAHLGRKDFLRHLLERRHGLTGTVTWRGAPDDLGGAVEIESVGVFRAADGARGEQRRERNHGAVVIPHKVILDVLVAPALFPFRLQVHAPLPAEAVELVEVEAAQVGLQGLIYVRHGDSLLQHFVAIHIGVELWDGSGEL